MKRDKEGRIARKEVMSPRSGKRNVWESALINLFVSRSGLLPELPSPAARLSHGQSVRR